MSIATGAAGFGVVDWPGVVCEPPPLGVEGVDGAGVGAGVEFVARGVAGVAGAAGVVVGAGAGAVLDGTVTFGSVLLPVLVVAPGAVVVEAGGVVAAGGGGVAAGGAWATCAAAALWLGGTVWSSRSAAYEAPTAPATSSAVRPNTAIAERTPGRLAMRPAAVPHKRHQSCPG